MGAPRGDANDIRHALSPRKANVFLEARGPTIRAAPGYVETEDLAIVPTVFTLGLYRSPSLPAETVAEQGSGCTC